MGSLLVLPKLVSPLEAVDLPCGRSPYYMVLPALSLLLFLSISSACTFFL